MPDARGLAYRTEMTAVPRAVPGPFHVYDETIRALRRAVDAARLAAVRRLDVQARPLKDAAD